MHGARSPLARGIGAQNLGALGCGFAILRVPHTQSRFATQLGATEVDAEADAEEDAGADATGAAEIDPDTTDEAEAEPLTEGVVATAEADAVITSVVPASRVSGSLPHARTRGAIVQRQRKRRRRITRAYAV